MNRPGPSDPPTPGTRSDWLDAIVVATHYWSPGWATALDEYLATRTRRYLWISHPLFDDGSNSVRRLRLDGRAVAESSLPGRGGVARHFAALFRTVRWTSAEHKWRMFVAGDNLLALAGLWLRMLGRVDAVVLYSIDYVPQRFSTPLANLLYHFVDYLAARHCDVVWNSAQPIVDARFQRHSGRNLAPHLIVPIGAHAKRVEAVPRTRDPHRIVYLGHLLEKQGVQVVIEALPMIRERVPSASLLVIGDGPYRPQLVRLAETLGVRSSIEFAGFMDDHVVIERLLADCGVGVAPYVPGASNYSQFQDLAGKVVTYLACGLAVITTNVLQRGSLVEEAGAGRVVSYSPTEFAAAIVEYLQDPRALGAASEAARRLGESYDWSVVFDRAFQQTRRVLDGTAGTSGP